MTEPTFIYAIRRASDGAIKVGQTKRLQEMGIEFIPRGVRLKDEPKSDG